MRWTFHLEGGPRRVNHAAALVGKKIYSFGGYSSSEDFKEREPIQVYVLDINTLRWAKVNYHNVDLAPFQRYGHTVVAYKGKIYLWGGCNNTIACNTLFEFDTVTLQWSQPEVYGMIPYPKDGHSACLIDGKMYLFGGFEYNTETFSQELCMIDLETLRWRLVISKGSPPSHRDFHSAVAVGDRMYVMGGRGDLNSPFYSHEELYCPDIYYFDTIKEEWICPRTHGDWPEGRRSQSAWYHSGYLYMFGGYNDNVKSHYNDLYQFSPSKNEWKLLSIPGIEPCKRRRQCCVIDDDKLFLFGGTSPRIRVNPETEETYEDTEHLIENSDLIILDYKPTLRILAILTVIEYHLDTTGLPKCILSDIEMYTTPNRISRPYCDTDMIN